MSFSKEAFVSPRSLLRPSTVKNIPVKTDDAPNGRRFKHAAHVDCEKKVLVFVFVRHWALCVLRVGSKGKFEEGEHPTVLVSNDLPSSHFPPKGQPICAHGTAHLTPKGKRNMRAITATNPTLTVITATQKTHEEKRDQTFNWVGEALARCVPFFPPSGPGKRWLSSPKSHQ